MNRILIVDDEPSNVLLLESFLTDAATKTRGVTDSIEVESSRPSGNSNPTLSSSTCGCRSPMDSRSYGSCEARVRVWAFCQ